MTNPEYSHQSSSNADDPVTVPPQSSTLADLPLISRPVSPASSETSLDLPGIQLQECLLASMKDSPQDETPQQSFQSTRTTGDSSVWGSFSSSRRVMKNGKEIVTGSDSDTDSIESLEDVDTLLNNTIGSNNNAAEKKDVTSSSSTAGTGPRFKFNTKTNIFGIPDISVPKHKNTLDLLVSQTAEDKKTEDAMARAKAAYEAQIPGVDSRAHEEGQARELNEDVLRSAAPEMDDEFGLSRVAGAVQRTNGYDRPKLWSAFDQASIPDKLEFPREAIAQEPYLAMLQEPGTRERALLYGFAEVAVSRSILPNELITWLFQSVPSEPREDMRDAYCRVFKHIPTERVKSCIRPKDVDELFGRLGAGPKTLALSDPIVPDPIRKSSVKAEVDCAVVLSVFKLFQSGADIFADDTRTHILILLFRLTVDPSLTADVIVSSELKTTITALLGGIPAESVEDTVRHICQTAYDTIKDVTFQSRLLTHILPTTEWIALFRCRLAVAFLTRSRSPLTEPTAVVLNLERIIKVLEHGVARPKSNAFGEYDYGELGATTILLNIAIDSSRAQQGFANKDAERKFNADVDLLAREIKTVYASIKDLGTSDLNRPLTKSAMDALWYRTIYSVRSKRRNLPHAYFGGIDNSQGKMDQYLSRIPKPGSGGGSMGDAIAVGIPMRGSDTKP